MRWACSCDLPPLLVAFDRFVGVSGVRLGVLGGCCVAGLDFDELRARLSSSYVAALLFVVGAADHSVRCFVIDRALCLLQRPHPTPHRVRSCSSIGSWVCRVFSGLCRSSRWSGCRRFGLPARTRAVLEQNGPAACFRGCCGAPSAPSGPCYLRGALWSAQEPHVYQKKTGSCAVYYIIAFGPFGDSDNRKFAAGVTTRHIRNNALRRTKGFKTSSKNTTNRGSARCHPPLLVGTLGKPLAPAEKRTRSDATSDQDEHPRHPQTERKRWVGGSSQEQAQRTSNHRTTNIVIGTDNKQQRGHI